LPIGIFHKGEPPDPNIIQYHPPYTLSGKGGLVMFLITYLFGIEV
jgi:hypothetical protein